MTALRTYLEPVTQGRPNFEEGEHRKWKVKLFPSLEVREWRKLHHSPPLYCFYEIWHKDNKIWESSHFQHPEAANKNLYKSIKAIIESKSGLFPHWLQETFLNSTQEKG